MGLSTVDASSVAVAGIGVVLLGECEPLHDRQTLSGSADRTGGPVPAAPAAVAGAVPIAGRSHILRAVVVGVLASDDVIANTVRTRSLQEAGTGSARAGARRVATDAVDAKAAQALDGGHASGAIASLPLARPHLAGRTVDAVPGRRAAGPADEPITKKRAAIERPVALAVASSITGLGVGLRFARAADRFAFCGGSVEATASVRGAEPVLAARGRPQIRAVVIGIRSLEHWTARPLDGRSERPPTRTAGSRARRVATNPIDAKPTLTGFGRLTGRAIVELLFALVRDRIAELVGSTIVVRKAIADAHRSVASHGTGNDSRIDASAAAIAYSGEALHPACAHRRGAHSAGRGEATAAAPIALSVAGARVDTLVAVASRVRARFGGTTSPVELAGLLGSRGASHTGPVAGGITTDPSDAMTGGTDRAGSAQRTIWKDPDAAARAGIGRRGGPTSTSCGARARARPCRTAYGVVASTIVAIETAKRAGDDGRAAQNQDEGEGGPTHSTGKYPESRRSATRDSAGAPFEEKSASASRRFPGAILRAARQ